MEESQVRAHCLHLNDQSSSLTVQFRCTRRSSAAPVVLIFSKHQVHFYNCLVFNRPEKAPKLSPIRAICYLEVHAHTGAHNCRDARTFSAIIYFFFLHAINPAVNPSVLTSSAAPAVSWSTNWSLLVGINSNIADINNDKDKSICSGNEWSFKVFD